MIKRLFVLKTLTFSSTTALEDELPIEHVPIQWLELREPYQVRWDRHDELQISFNVQDHSCLLLIDLARIDTLMFMNLP